MLKVLGVPQAETFPMPRVDDLELRVREHMLKVLDVQPRAKPPMLKVL